MKILASGCSFTAGGPNAGENWPTMMSRRHYVNNLAVSGAGNDYICRSTMHELASNLKFYDLVLVMWSGIQRRDIMLGQMAYNIIKHSKHNVSGGRYGFVGDAYTHNYSPEPQYKNYGKEYFKLSDEESLAHETLINMVSLQSFLKQIGVPYKFFSYVNYWNNRDSIKDLNFGLTKYQSCQSLYDQLDFDNFVFYNSQRDGLYEFAVENNLLDEDGFHPSIKGYQAWADWVKVKLEV